ncbi:MAG: protein kinase [Planctomycetota bacterium]
MRTRKCPQCGAPVTDDLPGGLCPACLMEVAQRSQPAATRGLPGRSEAPAVEDVAELFPELEVIELIGRGGMGAVYKVRQKNLDRIVALKVFLYRADDPEFAARFSREARALAKLNHPNIVTVHETGKRGSMSYLVMEFIDGLNLREMCTNAEITPLEAMNLVPQLCDALQYAHDQGVIHRDIKPENILVDRSGRIKIADFGLAKMTNATVNDPTLTHTQQVMGTLNYMAPEQRETPTEVDHRADIYSLGVVIYEMLTGELPLGRFQPPSKKVEVDIRIDEIVMRALEKEPGRRYQQISEFQTGLQSVGELRAGDRTPVPPVKAGDQAPFAALNQGLAAVEEAVHEIDRSLQPKFGRRKPVTAANLLIYAYGGVAMFILVIACPLMFIMGGGRFGFLDREIANLAGILCGITGGFMFAILGFVRRILDIGPADDASEKDVQDYYNSTKIGSAIRILAMICFFACPGLIISQKFLHLPEAAIFAGIAGAIVGGGLMIAAGSFENTFYEKNDS